MTTTDPILKENIFIKALEYGINNIEYGTTYKDFLEFLQKENLNLKGDFKHYMHV